MTDKSKLRQIRENIPKVYDSGWEVGYDTGNAEGFSQGYVQGYRNGTEAATPKGEVELTENNKTYDVTSYASAKVNIAGIEDLSTVLTEQEELVAELKSVIAQKAKLGDAKLPSIIDKTVTEITAEDLAGVTKIGKYAFSYNNNLKSVKLSETVNEIDSYAFRQCIYLANIDLANATLIRDNAYYYVGSEVKTDMPVIIKPSVATVGTYAFSQSGITSLRIESGVVLRIDSYAFSYCQNLKSVYIGNRTLNFDNYVFSNNPKLEQVTLEYGFTDLSTSTFYGCSSLKNIALPSSVYIIRSNAFLSCKALEYIDLTAYGTDGTFPTLTNTNAFNNCGTSTPSGTFEIRVKSGRKAELAAMTNWSTYADNIVEV